MHPPRLSLALLALTLCGPALAGPPSFTSIVPRAVRPGKAVTLVVSGSELTPATRLALPFAAQQKHLPDAKHNPAQIRLEVTAAADVAPGVYPVRLVNDDGLSTLALFRVDPLPGVVEVEDNNTFDKAQKVTWPAAVEGQCAGGDVDFFRVTAKKGQRVVAEVESARLGSGVLPQLRVTDAKKRLITSDDSQALAGDARVAFVAPADGDFVIELSDSRYRGGSPPFYRLRISEDDDVTEVFPLGARAGEQASFTLRGSVAKPLTFARKLLPDAFLGLSLFSRDGAMPLRLAVGDVPELVRRDDEGELTVKPPLVVNGRLHKERATDKVRIAVAPGQRWRFSVEAESLGSKLDGVLSVADEKGKVLLTADDVDVPSPAPGQPAIRSVDPSGELTVPAGVAQLVVSLRDQRERGGVGFGYRLTVAPAADDFSLTLPVAELNVPRGGALALSVPVTRRGFAGPVTLRATPPAGYRVKGGRVPEGGTVGVLVVESDDAPGEPAALAIEGAAKLDGKDALRPAPARLHLARESGAAGLYVLPKLAVARTTAAPFGVNAPATIVLVKGYPTEIPLKLTRGKGQEKLALTLTAIVPGPTAGPTGFTVPAVPPAMSDDAKMQVTAGVNAPEGDVDLAVQAQGRVGPRDVRVAASVAAVVKPPFVLTLDGPLELKPNQTAKLTGKVTREAVCKEPIRLTLAGLPPGVTLTPPKPVAAAETTFALEIKVGPKPGAATGAVTLSVAATVGGQNYAPKAVVVTVK